MNRGKDALISHQQICRPGNHRGRFVWATVGVLAYVAGFGSPAAALMLSAPGLDMLTTPGEPMYGMNFDGVGRVLQYGQLQATMGLISDRHVLTAAHLFDSDYDGQFDEPPYTPFGVEFELPSGNHFIPFARMDVTIPENWVALGADLAVVTLPEDAPPEAPRYSIYSGDDELGREIVLAGYGHTGLGSSGDSYNLNEKLAVKNRYEALGEEVPDSGPTQGKWAYDFDSGNESENTLAVLGFQSDLGMGRLEAMPSFGDSGAPTFIDGVIAGVVAHGASGYETDLDRPPKGKPLNECFDLESMTPSSEWGEIYANVKKELIDLGLPL